MTTFAQAADHDASIPTSAGPLGGLIAALRDADFRIAAAGSVAALMSDVRLDESCLAPYVHFATGRSTRTCLFRDARFELFVVCWPESLRSAIHDHGGSGSFVRVPRGMLRIDDFALVEGGRRPGYADLAHTGTQRLGAGSVDALCAQGDIHQVGALTGEAVSLHVYAAPLDRCLIFDREQMTCRTSGTRDAEPAAR